mmetsp:Transcript_16104/g.34894  ORF Transcript_16104/g.34894 Transcript_16104/m.34894 type:complete len:275 (+) Transcript_16104:283-1107(+)
MLRSPNVKRAMRAQTVRTLWSHKRSRARAASADSLCLLHAFRAVKLAPTAQKATSAARLETSGVAKATNPTGGRSARNAIPTTTAQARWHAAPSSKSATTRRFSTRWTRACTRNATLIAIVPPQRSTAPRWVPSNAVLGIDCRASSARAMGIALRTTRALRRIFRCGAAVKVAAARESQSPTLWRARGTNATRRAARARAAWISSARVLRLDFSAACRKPSHSRPESSSVRAARTTRAAAAGSACRTQKFARLRMWKTNRFLRANASRPTRSLS